MYPIRFEPIYQHYIWGGNQIVRKFNRPECVSPVAESWEVSDRDEGMSVVANGPFKGKTLQTLMREMGERLVGIGQKTDRFPLLLKIIDAAEHLSVQVHPCELTAPLLHGEPKSEMWFILEKGAVYAGLKKEVSKEQFSSAMGSHSVIDLIEKIDVERGDSIYIPGGTVHAICAPCMIFEVQQNSNTTYRLHDWGRVGRELHHEQGLRSIHFDQVGALHKKQSQKVSTPFFVVEKIDILGKLTPSLNPATFQVFFCIEGVGQITVDSHVESLEPGNTYLVPASSKCLEINGVCQLLKIQLEPGVEQ